MERPNSWYDPDYWGVVEVYNPMNFGVQNMSHDEIVAAILDDLLILHFDGLAVPWYEFFRFIKTKEQERRVLKALCDPRTQDLTTEYADYPQILRLKPDHDSLQKTMNLAGRWFEGFEIPPDTGNIISLATKGEEMIGEVGVDGLARYLAWKTEQQK